ncbi:MAG: SDR family oxidoreductase [Alphaproteobacteria bacterium]|nr:SDR family oxidoreductase [Alphaproteobacteria bacterium]
MNDFAGKVGLVTGGTSGFGAAIAKAFAARGGAVLLTGRDSGRGAAVERAIAEAGGRAVFVPGDVADPALCERLIAEAVRRLGRLDVLVNCAGIVHLGTAEATTTEAWRQVMAVNADAPFYLSRAAIPVFRRQGGGAIVNIASELALVGQPGYAAYCASKGALLQLTRVMALDHAREGIRVNALCAGGCDTPMLYEEFRQAGVDPAAGLPFARDIIPMGRLGRAEEIAQAALFLASDAAAFVTGAAFAVDGGNTAGGFIAGAAAAKSARA